MIYYRDFAAEITEAGFFSDSYETLPQALAKANAWLSQERVDVLNVETVVLPNLWASGEEGTGDIALNTSGKMGSSWHQFIRVWYRVG